MATGGSGIGPGQFASVFHGCRRFCTLPEILWEIRSIILEEEERLEPCFPVLLLFKFVSLTSRFARGEDTKRDRRDGNETSFETSWDGTNAIEDRRDNPMDIARAFKGS
jgi:hypothetical protein